MQNREAIVILGEAFNFNLEDLEANRAGLITERQRKAQVMELRKTLQLFAGMTAVFMMIGFSLVICSLTFTSKCEPMPCYLLPLADKLWRATGAASFLAGLPAFAGLWFTVRHFRNLGGKTLESWVNTVSTQMHRSRAIIYYLHAGSKRFEITEPQYELSWTDAPYKIYYLRHGNVILSVEPAAAHEPLSVLSNPLEQELNEPRFGELGQAFNFTEKDLEANRAGKVSQQQEASIGIRLGFTTGFLIFLPSFMTLIVLGFTIFMFFAFGSKSLFLPANCYFFVLLCPIAVLWYYKTSGIQEMWKDSKEIVIKSLDQQSFQEIAMKKKPFGMNQEQLELINSHQNLQLYVLEKSNYVLSLEEVTKE